MYSKVKSKMTPYNSRGNCQTESFNRTLCDLLKPLPASHKRTWSEYLSELLTVYNGNSHVSAGYSSYTFISAVEANVDFLLSVRRNDNDCNVHEWLERQLLRLHEAHMRADEQPREQAAAMKQRCDSV